MSAPRATPLGVAAGTELGIRFVAVDWSGARDVRRQREHIWVAVVDGGRLVELSAGRTRDETVDHVVDLSGATGRSRVERVVIGLDFSFGFPGWFACEHRCVDAPGAWALAGEHGEEWLRACPPPFFGHPGTRRPAGAELFRRTERAVARAFPVQPKSIFQIAGPGAVGTGSLRGMPLLARLQDAGCSIWPFDPASARTVVEIYPAVATAGSGTVVSARDRRDHLDAFRPGVAAQWPAAVGSRDAFDATVAAFLMSDHAMQLARLDSASREVGDVEGAVWFPA